MHQQSIIRRHIRLLLTLLCLLPLCVWSQSVQVSSNRITVKALFAELESKARVNFVYSDLGDELDKTVRLNKQTASVQDLLGEVEQQSSLRFTVNRQDIIVRQISNVAATNPYASLSGQVVASESSLALGYATVQLRIATDTSQVYRTVAGSDGRFLFAAVPKGRYEIQASYLGYRSNPRTIQLQSNTELTVTMVPQNQAVEEIHVTGIEQKGMTTSTIIRRDAIDHIQATSLTDVMALLPGGQAVPPVLASPNFINLREANPSHSNDNYAISSLGTLFVIDDIPISTDGNRQSSDKGTNPVNRQLPFLNSVSNKESVNFGMDMRSITTDNIESVEIIRGIPSVRYGDLTSGVVKIERTQKAQPFYARFKADQFSKLFALSKGFNFDRDWIVNVNLDYLDGRGNPINPLETYDRYGTSIRSQKTWGKNGGRQLRWNMAIDYTGQFDDWRNDPEQLIEDERYKLDYNSMGFVSRLSLRQPNQWLRTLEFNTSLRYSNDRIYQQRWPDNGLGRAIIPISLEEGVHDAIRLPVTYLATHIVEGKPLNAFATLRGQFMFDTYAVKHNTQAGVEWKTDKNLGKGQIFDITRPLNNAFDYRPYPYDAVPAMHHASFYIEDLFTLPRIYGNELSVQAGLRGGTMLNLDNAYALQGKLYVDPRFNARWELSGIYIADRPLVLAFTAGIGWLSKMPTMSMLYADVAYRDFVQVNHTDAQRPELSRYQVRTYVEDMTNHELTYTRNKKRELRMDAQWHNHHFSFTFFREALHSGFRRFSEPRAYDYQQYRDGAYIDRTVFRSVDYHTNGTTLTKQGLEFSLVTPRYPAIATRFTATGAYFKNDYRNSQALWFTGNGQNNPVVGGFVVYDNYAALYPLWRTGFLRSRTSTSFTADTYIRQHGLTLSLTADTYWRGVNNQWANNPEYPDYYLTTDNVLHEYTEADKTHEHRSFLYLPDLTSGFHSDNKSLTRLHFRGSKDFGDWLRMSLFVLNFVDINPHYDDFQGVRVRDASSAPYFGMELRLKL